MMAEEVLTPLSCTLQHRPLLNGRLPHRQKRPCGLLPGVPFLSLDLWSNPEVATPRGTSILPPQLPFVFMTSVTLPVRRVHLHPAWGGTPMSEGGPPVLTDSNQELRQCGGAGAHTEQLLDMAYAQLQLAAD